MTVLNQSEYNNGLILNDVKLKSMNAELFGNRLPNASTEPHVVSDGTEDLGSGSYRWKDGHFSGRLFSDNTVRAHAFVEVNYTTGAIINIYNNYGFSSITKTGSSSGSQLDFVFDPLGQPPSTDYYFTSISRTYTSGTSGIISQVSDDVGVYDAKIKNKAVGAFSFGNFFRNYIAGSSVPALFNNRYFSVGISVGWEEA